MPCKLISAQDLSRNAVNLSSSIPKINSNPYEIQNEHRNSPPAAFRSSKLLTDTRSASSTNYATQPLITFFRHHIIIFAKVEHARLPMYENTFTKRMIGSSLARFFVGSCEILHRGSTVNRVISERSLHCTKNAEVLSLTN